MDSVAAEIEQKNQETFPEPEKKTRKPRSDAGQKRGPRKLKGGKPEKKPAKKAAKKSRKKSVRNRESGQIIRAEFISGEEKVSETLFVQPGDVIRPHFGGSVNDIERVVHSSLDEARELGILRDETPWRDFGRALSALCGHISRRTGTREAVRRIVGAGRMIWSGRPHPKFIGECAVAK